jgi:dienelactone hydrolase
MLSKKLYLLVLLMVVLSSQAFSAETPLTVSAKTHAVKINGKSVEIDIYHPMRPHTGAAILTHGGFRDRKTMAGHAQALAERGVLVLAPDMPCIFDHRCNARAISELVKTLHDTDTFGVRAKRIILVGFSAGGLSSLLAANAPGVVGFVGLDAYDHLPSNETERLGIVAARSLSTETLLLRAPASSCNAQSAAAPWRTVLKTLWRDELIVGATHCDFEAPTDWLCRLACGETNVSRQSQVRQGLLDAVSRWLP